MFELPEITILAEQINKTLKGKKIREGYLGNSPHKFVWYNIAHDEFKRLTNGKTIGRARVKGKWLFISVDPGYVLLFGECGGRMLYHPPGSKSPAKYHLYIIFEDGSFFTVMTQMWGAMELYEKGQEQNRKYVKGMKTTPMDPGFTFDYLSGLIDDLVKEKKRSVKGLLTQDQLIPGLGNAIAQDILFNARLSPQHPIDDLDAGKRRALYDAIQNTVKEIISEGGRYDEYNLYNKPGNYVRIMDKNAVDRPCPGCGDGVKKVQYLGGACYYCPKCQV